METFVVIVAFLLSIAGVIGCFAPVIPGPPLSYLAVLAVYLWGPENADISSTWLWIWLAVTVVVTVLDYIVPAYVTKISGGSNSGAKGALAGMFVGIFLIPPLGMIAGSFLGALLSEMFFEGKSFKDSLKPAAGSFIGFLLGTGIKLIASLMMLVKLVVSLF